MRPDSGTSASRWIPASGSSCSARQGRGRPPCCGPSRGSRPSRLGSSRSGGATSRGAPPNRAMRCICIRRRCSFLTSACSRTSRFRCGSADIGTRRYVHRSPSCWRASGWAAWPAGGRTPSAGARSTAPLTALDPSLRDEVRATLLSLQAHYRPALVIVTHDLEDAAVLGDRIGILLGGTLAQLDQPERLFQRPASLAVARFLGIPNLVAGSVAGGQFRSALGTIPVEGGVFSGPATAEFGSDVLHPDPCGSLLGVVRAVHFGPRGATIRVEVAGLELEAATAGGAIPGPGHELSLRLESERVTILSGTRDV